MRLVAAHMCVHPRAVVAHHLRIASLEKMALLAALKQGQDDDKVVAKHAWAQVAQFLVGSVKVEKNLRKC